MNARVRRWLTFAALGAIGVACSSAPRPSVNSTASTAPPGGETATCRDQRLAILDAIATSRHTRACTVDADCESVTNPGHWDREYAETVAALDAPVLDGRSRAHLAACGAFYHHEAIAAFRVVTPSCVAGRCEGRETTFHVEE